MKKLTLLIVALFCSIIMFAQWEFAGLDQSVTALWPFGEEMVAGTDGSGILKTTDNGLSWNNISGNIGNQSINDIRGFASLTSMFVATDGGPFVTMDMVDYTDCTSTGLTNTNVNYFGWGIEELGGGYMVGTNGGGVYGSGDFTGPWTAFNTNISGDGLIINDAGGYYEDDQEYAIVVTDGGTYWSINGATEWTAINNGLTGDALKVKRLAGVGFLVLIATHDGLYYNYEMVDTWEPLVPGEKLNTIFIHPSSISPTGFMCFAFGENGFYSEDFLTWSPLVMTGVTGEVTAAHANSTHVFVGVTTTDKNGKLSGGIYKAPLDQLVVGVEESEEVNNSGLLSQNYPNPFSKTTSISYSLKSLDYVSIKIYDMFGKEVNSLVNAKQAKGIHQLEFDSGNLAEGIYFYTLQVGSSYSETKKMVIRK